MVLRHKTYTESDHKRAFELYCKYDYNIRSVASHKDLPPRRTLIRWKHGQVACNCPWHHWDELRAKMIDSHTKTLIEEDIKAAGPLHTIEQQFIEQLKEFKKIIEEDTVKLKFLSNWYKYVMAYISNSIKKEQKALAHVNWNPKLLSSDELSPFRPTDIKDAVKLLEFITKEEARIKGTPIPDDLLDIAENATSRNKKEDNALVLAPDTGLKEDKLMQVLREQYMLADKKIEGDNLASILNFTSD